MNRYFTWNYLSFSLFFSFSKLGETFVSKEKQSAYSKTNRKLNESWESR